MVGRVGGRFRFVDVWVKIANVLFLVKDQIGGALKAVGSTSLAAFVVVVFVSRVRNKITWFVRLANGHIGRRCRCGCGIATIDSN